jgi:two-component system, chemotaxis family, sensor kinase Cph1
LNPADSLQTALDACSREPIHIPGRIQPQGFLLAIAPADNRITHCSENTGAHIERDAADLLGGDFLALFDDSAVMREQMARVAQLEDQPLHLGTVRLAHKSFDLVAHRRGGSIIAEFEPAAAASPLSMFPVVDTFVSRLQQARSIETLCRLAVEEIQRLTKFGRVLAYTFDDEGHGNVIAEVAEPGYPSYQGLRFPASDIPEQARALYRLNHIRLISNADYVPVPLLAEADRAEPLDLSFAHLRSVSPVHVQYMKNMGTLASMSISIIVEDRLWGLISCHDAKPTPVPLLTRSACELLGKILSLQVEAREAHMQAERLLELRRMLVQLLATIADSDNFVRGFLDAGQQFLDFGRAHGVAIVTGETCATLGTVPDESTLRALTRWLDERGEHNVFATDSLGALNPEFAALAPLASGLLALSISELYPNYILWFRPELVRTVNWAGRPEKAAAGTVEQLSPRQSFETWSEIVRGQSQPWEGAEIDAAIELRAAVLGIVLRQAEEMAQLADELQRSNSELESFSYSVSHDLRAPLRHIAGYAELLVEDAAGTLSERAHRYLRNIGESARFAGTLVDDLLSFSQMGRAALRPTAVDLAQLIDHIRKEFAPELQDRDIEWVLKPLPIVQGDTAFLHLALRNLLANAVKYTGTREHARIEIGALDGAQDENIIYIRDNGVGFDMQYVDKLFGVFQRLHRMEEFEGTGIGLANVRRIIERHGGRVWGESVKDQGATFYFALPPIIPEDTTKRRGQTKPNA